MRRLVSLKTLLSQYDQRVAHDGERWDHLFRRGQLKACLGDFAGGWRDLERAFALDATAMAGVMEGSELGGTGRPAPGPSTRDMVRRLDSHIRRFPLAAEAWAWRGILRRRLLDYRGAAEDLSRAFRLGRRGGILATLRGEARLQSGDLGGLREMERAAARSNAPWQHAWLGRAVLAFKKDPAGLRHLDRAVELDPQDGWCRAWRAEAKRLLRKPAGMFRDFDAALRHDRGLANQGFVRTWRGLACVQQGRFNEALRDFNEALKAYPDYALAYHGRAQAHERLRRHYDWFRDFDASARLDVKYVDRLFTKPQAELVSSLDSLARVLRRKSPPAAARAWRGFLLSLSGRLEEAAKELDLALRKAPRDPLAWGWRGLVRCRLGDVRGALKDLSRSLELDPRNSWMRAWRSRVWVLCGKPESAVRDLDAAVAADGRFIWYRSDRGCLKLMMKDEDGACRDLSQVLARDPSCVGACVDLAAAHSLAGRQRQARRLLRRAERAGTKDAVRRRWDVWRRHLGLS